VLEYFSLLVSFFSRKILIFLLSYTQHGLSYKKPHLTSTKLQYNTGLYFEDVSTALFFSHEWKLYTTLNLTLYDEEYRSFSDSMNNIFATCEIIKSQLPAQSTDCDKSFSHLQSIINSIDYFNLSPSNEHKIVKRLAPIAVAVITTITLAATFAIGYSASYYSKDDEQVHFDRLTAIIQNNEQRDTILSEQTTYINSISEAIANDTNNLNDYLNILSNKSQSFYNKIGEFSNSFSEHIFKLQIKALVHDIMSIATVIIINFQKQQQTLNNFLSISTNSKNNPFILPPKIFYKELTIIQDLVANEYLNFPFKLCADNLPLFYQISTVKATLIDAQLVILFSIPLVKLPKFTLFKITTIPIRINDTVAAYIIPRNDFVAIDYKFRKYILLGKNDINEAVKLNGLLIFKLKMPIADFVTVKSCEINIFKSEEITDECDIRLTTVKQENWIALSSSNTWIFSPFGSQKLRVDCFNNNNTSEYFYIDELSIVNISANCQVFSAKFTLTAFQTFSSSFVQPVHNNVRFSLEINNTINEILQKEHELESIDFSEIIPNVDRDSLLKIFHDSTRLKEKLKTLRSFPSISIAEIGLKEIFVTLIIFAASIILIKIFINLVKLIL
jgi:hypothetical protein